MICLSASTSPKCDLAGETKRPVGENGALGFAMSRLDVQKSQVARYLSINRSGIFVKHSRSGARWVWASWWTFLGDPSCICLWYGALSEGLAGFRNSKPQIRNRPLEIAIQGSFRFIGDEYLVTKTTLHTHQQPPGRRWIRPIELQARARPVPPTRHGSARSYGDWCW